MAWRAAIGHPRRDQALALDPNTSSVSEAMHVLHHVGARPAVAYAT